MWQNLAVWLIKYRAWLVGAIALATGVMGYFALRRWSNGGSDAGDDAPADEADEAAVGDVQRSRGASGLQTPLLDEE